jgi:predicted CxxxxCH...CXXCH cytochrome family protein
MKRICAVTWALALFTIIYPMSAGAVNNPSHFGYAAGINCQNCHQIQRTLGANNNGPINRTSPAVFNNLCQSCHRTGDGFAKAKPMALVDTSAIFGDHSTANFGKLRQTSHRWDGSDTNPGAGAQPPIQAAMTTSSASNGEYNLRGRVGFQLACIRCHAPHLDNAPGAMLRMPIDQAQMCVDCHRSRNKQSHLSGTHPVGINYDTATGSFNRPNPVNANSSNPTSDLNNYLTVTTPSRNIVCTTCHGVHYTDSRSSTFDGASTAKGKGNYTNLSTGDGYQLRTDRRGAKVSGGSPDKLNICTNCHGNKKSHNAKDQDIQCNDCHGAHVEFDATSSSTLNPQHLKNTYLIRRNVKKGGMPSKIYFRYTGSQREYKNTTGTGVCQGCHNVPEAGGKYPPEHDSGKASDCNKCHFHSSQAGSFSGSCGQCHGMPPASATPGAGGLATPATGALAGAIGAHSAHVTTGLKMECNTCHSGYASRTMPNNTIDIGFEINGVNVPGFTNVLSTGTYNNTNTLSNGYVFTGSVGSGTNQTCTAIYCHGSTLTGGSNTNPSWVGTNQVQCGTCHGTSAANPPTTGGHARHAGNGAGQLQRLCADCHGLHNDNTHVNGNVKWNMAGINGQYKTPSGRFYRMSGSTGRLAPSTGYGTCTTIYCHSNGGPNGAAIVYNTVTWGGAALNCGSCHANMSTITSAAPNGGHYKHASTGNAGGPAFDCSICHSGYTAFSTNGATHANSLVELITAITGYSKSSPMAAKGAWGTCSASQCHGQATGLTWNNGSIWQTSGDHCTTCHSSTTSVTAGTPFYSTEFPVKQIGKTNAKVGAHTYHLTNLQLMSRSFVCADCHGTVALKDATHMNGTTNFAWSSFTIFSSLVTKKVLPSYNQAAGTCSNYCHGAVMPGTDTSGNNRTPSWKTPFMPATLTLPASCNSCHGFPPTTGGHPVVLATLVSCHDCHDNVNASATGYADVFVDKSKHINGIVEGGGCNGCHGYPPTSKNRIQAVATQNNWSGARMENYSGGGGAHTVAAHLSPTVNPRDGWANCAKCHNENDHVKSPVQFLPSTNIKVSIDQKFRFSVDRAAKYTSNKLDGAAHVPGKCSSVSCHFQKTPDW